MNYTRQIWINIDFSFFLYLRTKFKIKSNKTLHRLIGENGSQLLRNIKYYFVHAKAQERLNINMEKYTERNGGYCYVFTFLNKVREKTNMCLVSISLYCPHSFCATVSNLYKNNYLFVTLLYTSVFLSTKNCWVDLYLYMHLHTTLIEFLLYVVGFVLRFYSQTQSV